MDIDSVITKKPSTFAIAHPNSKLLNLGQSFPKQAAFTEDPARYLVAQCSRRAGKSTALAIRFMRTLDTHPGAQCIYLSLTRESALAIMWPVLIELNDKYGLGCEFIESKLIMVYPNGAKLRLIGADMRNFIKRLKGIKSPGIAIDEAQDFGDHLETLVNDVLTPTLTDYKDSWLAITGTPGCVPKGYFYDITEQKKYGYSFHEWTLLDNTYLPNAGEFITDLQKKREWKDDHPTLLREWRNKWVLDRESLWIKYHPEKDNYETLPVLPNNQKWDYILGIDVGFKDADALAVLAWSEHDPNTYLVEELVMPRQGLTELVEQIHHMESKYDISKMVIDEGGLGKKLAEELRRRHHIPVQPADKARKQENVGFLNDALRTGKFKAKENTRFVQDSYKIQIDWEKSTPQKIVIRKIPHSDIIDSVLYAFKESPAFTYSCEPDKPAYGTREWKNQLENELWEKELEGMRHEQEYNKRIYGEDE